jgi:hypothetical protein
MSNRLLDSFAYVDCSAQSVEGTPAWRRDADYTPDGPTMSSNWQATPGTVEINQDRLGMIPVFWWSGDDRFVASTSVLRVASRTGARQLDWDAISSLFSVGNFFNERTAFAGISTIPPGAKLKWTSAGGIEITRSDLRPPKTFDGTKAQAKTIFADLFRQAVARRLPNDTTRAVIPLSGGRDSRHIALEVAGQRRGPLNLITIRCEFSANDEDVRVAGLVAQRLKSPHAVIDIDWRNFVEFIRLKNFHTHFQVHVDHHSLFELAMSGALKDAVVFFGTGGDVLIGDTEFDPKLEALLQSGHLTEAATHPSIMGDCKMPIWFKPRGARTLSCERSENEILRFLGDLAPSCNLFRDYVLFGRQSRNTALVPYDLILRQSRVATPFLDTDLLAFQRSLPSDPFGPFGIHDEIIADCYPDFADIEYERKGLDETPLPERRRLGVRSVWRNFEIFDPSFRRHVSQSFFWPRLLSASFGSGINEMWWLQKMIYLVDLLRLSANFDEALEEAEDLHQRLLKPRTLETNGQARAPF